MRWLCSLILASPALGQAGPAKPLRFDLMALPATRDSFVFVVDGVQRGFAVWQYETRQAATGEQVVFTQYSQLEPVEEEERRMVLDRLTGRPITLFYHLELFSPASDTLVMELELEVKQGMLDGRRRVRTKDGGHQTVPLHRPLPPDAVFSSYEMYAAAVTNAAPGDSLAVPAYGETRDSLATLWFVAGQPTSVRVPAGRFDVLPLRSGDFRLYVTRTAPRRVVKGETDDGRFRFELAGTAPVFPSQP